MVSDTYNSSVPRVPFSSLLSAAAAKGLATGDRSHLAQADLESILIFTDAALDLFRKNEGKLNAVEIRLRSMLAVVRREVADELTDETNEAA
jgi:hypothetical protein